jgi:hypothetical protein
MLDQKAQNFSYALSKSGNLNFQEAITNAGKEKGKKTFPCSLLLHSFFHSHHYFILSSFPSLSSSHSRLFLSLIVSLSSLLFHPALRTRCLKLLQ